MALLMGTHQLWDAQVVTTGAASTSAAIGIGQANALALHLTAIAGTALDVTFTYSLSTSRTGTFVTPVSPVTIKANAAAVDVLDFSPEAAGWIKIIATNNSANSVTFSAVLAVQEAA